MGTWAEVSNPARGIHLLLGWRGRTHGYEGERIQPDDTKPWGTKLHRSQKSLPDGKCERRLSSGGTQYTTDDIKDSFISFDGYLYCTSAKQAACYCTQCCTPRTRILLLPQQTFPCFYCKTKSEFQQNSSHLGLLEQPPPLTPISWPGGKNDCFLHLSLY